MIAEHKRKVWSNTDRLRAAEEILDSGDPRQAMRELMRQYKLQPYQVYAWIGQAAIGRAADAKGKQEIRAPRVVEQRKADRTNDNVLAAALQQLTDALSKRG